MEACKNCGYPVPAVVVGKGYRVMCPACGATTGSYYRESEAIAEWEQVNKPEEPKVEPPKKKTTKKKAES